MAIQFFWIKSAITLKKEQFDRTVNMALIRVSADLQSKYGIHLITEQIAKDSAALKKVLEQDPGFYRFMIKINNDGKDIVEDEVYDDNTIDISGNEEPPYGGVNVRTVSSNQKVVTVLKVNNGTGQTVTVNHSISQCAVDQPPMPPVPPQPPVEPYPSRASGQLIQIVKNVADEYAFSKMSPGEVCSIIDSSKIRASITREFQKAGLPDNFEFATYCTAGDSLMINKVEATNPLAYFSYQSPLLATDFVEAGSLLLINFPGQFKYLFESIAGMLLLSLAFTLAIVSAFAYSLHLIFKQKKLSDITNDFINNMTHELKTPLATISLTADTLALNSVSGNSGLVTEYSGLIKTEVKKLSRHVDRILGAAVNEQNDNVPAVTVINLSELVKEEVELFEPQVKQKEGYIGYTVSHPDVLVHANKDLLRGVICNLLDNALKYAKDTPHITITVIKKAKTALLSVEDRGIGISKSEQKLVFEKFYRSHTGNRHDVKGFGLGLSFAKDVIEHAGGKIGVQSEPGKGSKFFVELPLI